METKELEKEFLTMIEAQKRTIYKVCYIYANDQDDLNGISHRDEHLHHVPPTLQYPSADRPHDGQCGKHGSRRRHIWSIKGTLPTHQPAGEIGTRADSPLAGRTEL